MIKTVVMLVSLFGPGCIAVLIYNWSSTKKAALREWIFSIVGYTFIILLLNCMVVFLRGHITIPFEELFGTVNNIVKYGALSVVFAVALPNALLLCQAIFKGIWNKKGKADE